MSEAFPNVAPRYAVLASGDGTTAEALADAIYTGQICGSLELVITDKPDAGIVSRVERWRRERGFDTQLEVINNELYPHGPNERGQTVEAAMVMCRRLEMSSIDLVAQLGYLVIGKDPYIAEWGYDPEKHQSIYEARAVNTHPALLPLTAGYYGRGAIRRVLEAYDNGEVTESAQHLHVVAHEVDKGPVFATHRVPIHPMDSLDTLQARSRIVEQSTIGYALAAFANARARYLHHKHQH
jgi:folate-dependent phosphoribosylglycinamide formyltransferase PurN